MNASPPTRPVLLVPSFAHPQRMSSGRRRRNLVRHRWPLLLGAGLVLFASGCTHVSVMHQRLVSKSNMTFSDSAVFDYGTTLHPAIEPGTSGSGGAQASGCTSCK